jgi:hypothetical protein
MSKLQGFVGITGHEFLPEVFEEFSHGNRSSSGLPHFVCYYLANNNSRRDQQMRYILLSPVRSQPA